MWILKTAKIALTWLRYFAGIKTVFRSLFINSSHNIFVYLEACYTCDGCSECLCFTDSTTLTKKVLENLFGSAGMHGGAIHHAAATRSQWAEVSLNVWGGGFLVLLVGWLVFNHGNNILLVKILMCNVVAFIQISLEILLGRF